MEDIRQCRLVWACTTNLDAKLGVRRASLFETIPNKSEGVVPFGHNEQPNYFFVSVYDKIASSL